MKKLIKRGIHVLAAMVIVLGSATLFGVDAHAAGEKYISTEKELRDAIKQRTGTANYIILNNDIYVNGDLKVEKDTFIDMRLHRIIFEGSKNGIKVQIKNQGVLSIENGIIYGACDSSSAINLVSGTLSLTNISVYGGYGRNPKYYSAGNALYCSSRNSNIYLNSVYFEGGNGYMYSYEKENSRRAKGLYIEYSGCNIYSIGRGYTVVDGQICCFS